VHIGQEGGKLLTIALGGGESPHVLLTRSGEVSEALKRLVDNLTVGHPSLLEALLVGRPRLTKETRKIE